MPDVQNALFDSAAGGAHVDSELEHDDRRVEGKGAGGWDFVENYTVAVQVAGHKNMYADRGSLLCYIMYYSSTTVCIYNTSTYMTYVSPLIFTSQGSVKSFSVLDPPCAWMLCKVAGETIVILDPFTGTILVDE